MFLIPGELNNKDSFRGDVQWLGELVYKTNNEKIHACKYNEISPSLQLTSIIK